MRSQSPATPRRLLASLLGVDPTPVQGIYYLLTGLWPLVHLPSFVAVTGRKRETWLVKTVGALVISIGLALVWSAWRRRITPEVRQLGATSALALLGVETYYAGAQRISPIYLADAALEAGLLALHAQRLIRPQAQVAACAQGEEAAAHGSHGRWDIWPGESRNDAGHRDLVEESSMESFPASDPPSYTR